MKKIFWFIVSLALAASLGLVLKNACDTASFFQENGREATLKVGQKYNASRWAEPLPLKKIHAYTAVLLPDHEVLIESDQELPERTEYFIRFLTRDVVAEGRALSPVPLVNTIRLKSEADGTPVKLADTDLMDRAIDKAMGPQAEGVYVAPRVVAEAAPDRVKPTVPFFFAGTSDAPIEIVWNNSTVGELSVVVAWILASLFFFLQACSTPFFPGRKAGWERKDFVHPSQRRIDADAPDAPSTKIKLKPRPADEPPSDRPPSPAAADPTPPPPPRTASIPLPPGMKITPRPPAEGDDSRATTAPPFVPPGGSEQSLKLKRRAPDNSAPPPTEPPAQA